MKKVITLSAVFVTATTLATAALAANDMAGMKMDSGVMNAPTSDNSALTDAVVMKVDPTTGMVTLKHGDLKNINMSAMTMVYKAKDPAMVKQAKPGEKVKVRWKTLQEP
ncbi:copper-binding protein [Caballeronia sordidicola]|uniref:Cu/Ag efflux protein CusF n=1 Tax=Caballeronia sordidicola TaxID=196367 RepID=A0A242N8A1_CABSO|nr:hypothetical protein PAMC26510_05360 [Caballeronia sordidicola]